MPPNKQYSFVRKGMKAHELSVRNTPIVNNIFDVTRIIARTANARVVGMART
jgi:hypothetical protein